MILSVIFKSLVFFCSLNLLALNIFAKPPQAPAPKKPQAQAHAVHALSIEKLAEAIQKHYNSTTSATFSFTQNYKHPFLPAETSKGKVFFKARNMLWRYEVPEDRQKEFFINGNKAVYHQIKEKLAFTHDCFDQDTLSASITFLLGKGRLRESFTISPYTGAKDPKSSIQWLTLTPKEKDPSVKSISLGAEPKTGIVKESIVIDANDGVNHFIFSDFRANAPVAPDTFIFKAKPGVRVQPMPNTQCPRPVPAKPQTGPKNTPKPQEAPARPIKNPPKQTLSS